MDTENYVSSPKPSVPSENDSLSTLVNKVKEVGVYTDELRSDLINVDNSVVDLLGDGTVGKLPTNATLTQAVDKSGEVGTAFANNLNGVKGELDVVKGEVAKKMDIHTHPYKSDSYVPSWGEVTGKPGNASTSSGGFMSNTDKSKLDGIANNANNYIHPNDANTRHVSDSQINTWNNKSDVHNHPYKPDSYVPAWSEVSGKPGFHSVATSGDYNSLNNKPVNCYEVLGSSTGKRYIKIQGVNLATKDCLKLSVVGSNDYDADEKTCGDYTILIKGHSSNTFSAEFIVNRDAFNTKGENIGLKDVYFNPGNKSIFIETHNASAASGAYSKYYIMPSGKSLSLSVSMTDSLDSGSSLANKINALETGLPNSSYSTSNGVKEFSSYNNMYVDNIAIQGQTKILNANNQVVNPGASGARLVSVGQGDKIDVLSYNGTYLNFTLENGDLFLGTGEVGDSGGTNLRTNDFVNVSTINYIYTTHHTHVLLYDSNKTFIRSVTDVASGGFVDLRNVSYIKLWLIGENRTIKLIHSGKCDKKQISTTLRSLPNGVKDEIVQQGDRYYKIVRCGEATFTGIEGWEGVFDIGSSKQISLSFSKVNPMPKNQGYIISNRLQYGHEQSPGRILMVDNYIMTRWDSSYSTMDVFKNSLSNNPLTVVYELATPQIIEIPNPNPRTFADKTTFLLNSGVVQAEASFEVTNSLGSALEVMADKVSSLDDNYIERYDLQPLNGWGISESHIIRENKLVIMNITFRPNDSAIKTRGTIIAKLPTILKSISHCGYQAFTPMNKSLGLIEIWDGLLCVTGTQDILPSEGHSIIFNCSYYIN